MAHRVRFGEQAWRDADEIYDWIAAKADPETAERYVGRIIDFCETLRDFPDRGTPRGDLAAGVRTMPFERRAIIAYVVESEGVRILRVLHKGRDA